MSSRVSRLNSDGSLDSGFNLGAGTNDGRISAAALQPDGKIVLAGQLTAFGGITRSGVVRLNPNGSVDTGFNHGAGTSNDSEGTLKAGANAVIVQSDGKIVVGGGFRFFDGVASLNIVRLNTDGGIDLNFGPGSELDPVGALLSQKDGKLVVGGNAAFGLVRRLNTDGSLDSSFTTHLPGLFVSSIALQADAKIIVGGELGDSNVLSTSGGIARLNPDGSVDNVFQLDATFLPSTQVNTALTQVDSKVVVGGQFAGGIVRVFPDGSKDTGYKVGAGANGPVMAIGSQTDNSTLVGGAFSTFNGAAAANLLRLLPDGSIDVSFTPLVDALVAALVVQTDGKVIIGGDFSTVNGQPRSGLARLNRDGSLDPTFSADVDGGNASAERVSFPRLSVGPHLLPPQPGAAFNSVPRKVRALAYLPGTSGQPDKLLVGGGFARILGVLRAKLAQIVLNQGSLAVDNTFDPGVGPDAMVNALAVQADGNLLVGGDFANVSGMTRAGLARLSPDGRLDVNFNANLLGTDANPVSVRSLALTRPASSNHTTSRSTHAEGYQPAADAIPNDEKLLVGGSFAKAGNAVQGALARLFPTTGTNDTSFNPGTGADGSVNTVAPQSDGRTIIGGAFNSVNGTPRPAIARLLGDSNVAVVSVVAKGNATTRRGGAPAKFVVSRAASDVYADLTVRLKVQGTAVNGVDYQAIKNSVVIPAGATSVKLKVKPTLVPSQTGPLTVTIKIKASATGAYKADAANKATISILDGN